MPELQVILKVASRCNLNCTYCYVYNKGDMSWQHRPALMPPEIMAAALRRTRDHCISSGQPSVRITYHGGEPCLARPDRFASWCKAACEAIKDVCTLELSIQTNGTLIDDAWIDVFRRYGVSVGLSIDGPPEMHDHARVDHLGRGSYDRASRGLALLRDGGVPFQVLCVVQPGADGLRVHRHLIELGANRINYLLPDFTHDTIAPVREAFGPTPCSDYLLPILDDWWNRGAFEVRIGIFWTMARVILGGESQLDVFGNRCYQYVFVETDGAIEGLDVLKICRANLSDTHLHVLRDEFAAIANRSALHRAVIFEGLPLPRGCERCAERTTCGGGYLPHRYAAQTGFDNPSVWCEDTLRLFRRMRELLNVNTEETEVRRAALREMREYVNR